MCQIPCFCCNILLETDEFVAFNINVFSGLTIGTIINRTIYYQNSCLPMSHIDDTNFESSIFKSLNEKAFIKTASL